MVRSSCRGGLEPRQAFLGGCHFRGVLQISTNLLIPPSQKRVFRSPKSVRKTHPSAAYGGAVHTHATTDVSREYHEPNAPGRDLASRTDKTDQDCCIGHLLRNIWYHSHRVTQDVDVIPGFIGRAASNGVARKLTQTSKRKRSEQRDGASPTETTKSRSKGRKSKRRAIRLTRTNGPLPSGLRSDTPSSSSPRLQRKDCITQCRSRSLTQPAIPSHGASGLRVHSRRVTQRCSAGCRAASLT